MPQENMAISYICILGKIKNINDVIDKDVMNVAFLSLGGNKNNRLENLDSALKAISKSCGTVLKQSSIFETAAWGTNSKKKYLNQVIKIKTGLSAAQLLKHILEIEQSLGRKRNGHQYADRTIDIDILFYNADLIETKTLAVPHPRLHLRKFVLLPFYEIEKNFVHPDLKKTISTLLKTCKDDLEVTLFKPAKALTYICIEGNIGSGKSTLAKFWSKKLNADYLPENFEDNSLLSLFYKDPKRFAFSLEYSFLISRFEQLKKHLQSNKRLVISDFSFYKSLWFAKLNLQKKEYLIFKKQFDVLLNQLPKPDLIVYLNTGIDQLKNNIKNRSRSYEKDISTNYLEGVSKVYSKGMNKLSGIQKINISITNYHPKLESELVKNLEKYVKQNFG